MTTKKIADLVVGIPFGNEGKKRWQQIGALLHHDDNDASKGPGFTVVLKAWVNLAGLPFNSDGDVFASCFHPTERPTKTSDSVGKAPPSRPFRGDEDDIPF